MSNAGTVTEIRAAVLAVTSFTIRLKREIVLLSPSVAGVLLLISAPTKLLLLIVLELLPLSALPTVNIARGDQYGDIGEIVRFLLLLPAVLLLLLGFATADRRRFFCWLWFSGL